jgi:hypothetical protein
VLFRSQAYSTKTVFDKQSIQFLSKHLKQALQKKDVVFYQAPPGVRRTFNWMYISAGVQLMFWYAPFFVIVISIVTLNLRGNLASLAYVAYAVKDGYVV